MLQIAPEVVWCPVEGEMVLFHAETGEYYGLNEVAARIWRLLSEGLSPDEAVERLLSTYEVDRETALAEVQRLIEELQSSRLVIAEP